MLASQDVYSSFVFPFMNDCKGFRLEELAIGGEYRLHKVVCGKEVYNGQIMVFSGIDEEDGLFIFTNQETQESTECRIDRHFSGPLVNFMFNWWCSGIYD
jgi:hypothetical protein